MTNRFFVSVCCLLALLAPAMAGEAQFKVLYNFADDSDKASNPSGDLVLDASGNLYGVTSSAGGNVATIFKLSSNGVKTTLTTFPHVRNGAQNPLAPLARDDEGNIFGAAATGGPKCGRTGCGAIFKIAPDGTATTLLALSHAKGVRPGNGLVLDDDGNLFGTVHHGRNIRSGAIFKLSPDGQYTLLYALRSHKDGQYPGFGLVSDSQGNFYGATPDGGRASSGTIFRYAPDGTFKVMHVFGGADGFFPQSPLTVDSDGNVYGALSSTGPDLAGSVFRIAPDGTFTTLHVFNGQDGRFPETSPVIDKNGDLYGTTRQGGPTNDGVLYRFAHDGTFTVLHSFSGADGDLPGGRLVSDGHGHLFGAAEIGGGGSRCAQDGCGVIFEVDAP